MPYNQGAHVYTYLFAALPENPKILWQLSARSDNGLSMEYDGIPFIFVSKRMKICHHGRDKGLSAKKKYKEEKEI